MRLDTMYLEVSAPTAQIVLNRPSVLNCANRQWVADLHAIADRVAEDDEIRVVTVRGAGRAFCTGIDLTALSSGQIGMDFFSGWETALRKLETLDKILVCAIQSHCIGGGLQLALACDLRIARDDGRFGVTAVKEGIIPGMGMWRVARFAGLGRAKRLVLTADVVDAPTALAWGLVDWVVSAADFESTIARVTQQALDMGWTSTRLAKKLSNMAIDASFEEAFQSYVEFQRQSVGSPEHRQAMDEHRASKRR
ncbi:MAG: enoyl-CoA hydratase/isomerase family protein [Vicinamibacterales bacterium]